MSERSTSKGARPPTVRQREVLGRVGEVFTAEDVQRSACHKHAGYTRRLLAGMIERGAAEAIGDGRYRKTALAVPDCPTEPAPKKRRKGRKGGGGKKGASGKASSGKAASGKAASGKAASGKAASGKAAAGDKAAHEAAARQPEPSVEGGDTPYTITAGRHTRDGHPIWTVQLQDRVPKDRFDELKRLAREAADPASEVNSGYYSAYKRYGAVPGFIFGSEGEARRFVERALALPAKEVLREAHSSEAAQIWPDAPEKPGRRTGANLLAVKIAHSLRESGKAPTVRQRDAMLRYSGWGGLSIDKVRPEWPEGVPLPANRALVHEYYTPWQVCADMTAAVDRLLGGDGVIRALEPSAGVGRFVHTTAPTRWQWTAIELSPLSALILSQTVPDGSEVFTGSFEGWVDSNGGARFDAVVSNPPYGPRGEQITEDKDRRFRVKAAYEYFVRRSLTVLRPGGVAAFLIPGGFLTGKSKRKLRERVNGQADLLAAFRLPSGIFPGARLTLDVVFLGARTGDAEDAVFVEGRYFEEWPSHVLGEVKASGRWGGEEVLGEYEGLPAFEPRFGLRASTVRVRRRGPLPIGDREPPMRELPPAPPVEEDKAPAPRLRAPTLPQLGEPPVMAPSGRVRVAARDVDGTTYYAVERHDGRRWVALAEPMPSDEAIEAWLDAEDRVVHPELYAAEAARWHRSSALASWDDIADNVDLSRSAIKAALADGTVLHLTRSHLAIAELSALLDPLGERGPWTIIVVRPGRGRPQVRERLRARDLFFHARQQGRHLGRVVLYTNKPYLMAESEHVDAETRLSTAPDAVGVFAERKGASQVIALDHKPLGADSNIDGMMQHLAGVASRTWILHSHTAQKGPTERYERTVKRVAARHRVEVEAVRFEAAGSSATVAAVALPEPKLPALRALRRRRGQDKAHRRAARVLPRSGGDDGLRCVWHTQGRALGFDTHRLVEVPSSYDGPTLWRTKDDTDGAAWPMRHQSTVTDILHHVAGTPDDILARVDAEALRGVLKPIADRVLFRVRDGEFYVEDAELMKGGNGRHIGAVRGADVLGHFTRSLVVAALSRARGAVTLRLFGRGERQGIAFINRFLVVDREDGERHVIAARLLADAMLRPLYERALPPKLAAPDLEVEGEPAPAAAPTQLAPGFVGLEMEGDELPPRRPKAPKPSGAEALPVGLRAVEMERVSSALDAAIARARAFTDPSDAVLSGVRVGEGKVIASDGRRVVELVVDDDEPVRVLDGAGQSMDVDYPEPGELIAEADPLATVPTVRLDQVMNHLSYGPVRLSLDRRRLSVASGESCEVIKGATATRTSSDGEWTFDGRHLRDALQGAKGGSIRFGAGRSATVIERDDGERHLLLPLTDEECEACPVCVPDMDEVPLSPPQGPDETTLAALLASRVEAYERADARKRALLHPELAGALDAFHATFGRRLARLSAPLHVTDEIAASAADARRLLRRRPAGVPLDQVRAPRELLRDGWRLDGDRLLPRDDYLSGNLWARLDRLAAIPADFADVEPGQRGELESAIGEVSFAELSDRISLRDGWVPLPVIAAFIGSLTRTKRITLHRRHGLVQLHDDDASYEAITKAYDGRSPVRLIIGYINHDEKVFSPKRKKGEDINVVRREKSSEYESQFRAFLSAEPEHRDAVVEAYRRAHKGFLPRTYSGDPLELARWGDAITPHPHQNAGARRAVDQRGMVAAYGVGVGKTFTACATVALARQRLGTRRPVILVPNSLVSKWQRDIRAALPDFAVVTIGEKATIGRGGKLRYGPDSKADREVKWRRFREGLYDVALITVTAFLRTRLGADEFEGLVANSPEVQRQVRLSQRNANARSAGRRTERQQAVLEQGVRAWLAQMTEATHELDDIRWAELGVDLLIVDEAQNYKGLHQPENREGGIPRFMGQSAPSKRAWGLDARARQVRANAGFVVLLSATPAKNSPLELYNLWSYVNGELWRDHGIHDPEAFISRFLELRQRLVIGTTMEATTRLAVTGFKNLDELKAILLRWGEFIQPADIGLEVPEPETELVEVDLDEAQEEKYASYVKQVEDELDAMRQGWAGGHKLLGLLGRMALVAVHADLDEGLDFDSAGSVPHRSPKFDAIADDIMSRRSCGHIVFVQAIAAHRWLKETLVARGMAEGRIGILNAVLARNSAARQRIADRFNAGQLDVVIANSIAYEGLDLQQRTCAVHHADLPWEPATLNQRNGRAVRQGNELATVAIRYYFARRSMDGLRFNIIQGKQGWLGALLEGSDAIANPGAQLDLGPEEVLLLISRTPEETRRKLDAIRAKAEEKRRREETERAYKLLASAAGQLAEARDSTSERRTERLRMGAEAAFDALGRVESDIWPWHGVIAEARRRRVSEILSRTGCPPLFPGAWVRLDGKWYEVGRLGWDRTERAIWLREPASSTWTMHKAGATAGARPDDVVMRRPAEVADDWRSGVIRLVESTVYNPYRGWPAMGWSHAAPAWLREAWLVAGESVAEQARRSIYYGSAPESRYPYDVDGAIHIQRRGGAIPAGAVLLAPTDEGWRRWLDLAVGEDQSFELRAEAARWWWGRGLRRGAQRTRRNPSRKAYRTNGAHMKLPPHTAIGSYLLLGVDHGDRLAYLGHEATAREAQRRQREVPADIPTVVIVKVENNGRAATESRETRGGDPVYFDGTKLKQDAGVVVAADLLDEIAMVVPARDLDHAYTINSKKIPAHLPRTIIGTVRYRYGSAR